MKHLRLFEDVKNEPKVRDYVVVDPICDVREEVKKFLSKNIGQVCRKDDYVSYIAFFIKYENVPKNLNIGAHSNDQYYLDTKLAYGSDILFFSPDKKDCELFLEANKYNI